jgi:CheY-like chemotaxis protein
MYFALGKPRKPRTRLGPPERHGGVCVRSRVKPLSNKTASRCEFVMRLPLIDALPKHEPVAPSAVPGLLRSRRILLVDDNEAFATAMASLLNSMGHDVQAIHDGAAAIVIARALRPQVVLLDINLPGKRGYDIAREIRADPALASSLLIAVTGYGQEQDKQQALRAGFDHHLTKPVDENALERLINQALP